MSNSKMLIDATHPEETRVVVQRNGRVEEFDFESAARKLLRGNIYLAKVTRVEPSLQAAFVDYGGNRHGFLAFNEIHPDYYQIPVADRQALIDEEAAAEAELEAAADRRAEALERRSRQRPAHDPRTTADTDRQADANASDDGDHESEGEEISNIVDVEEDDEHIEVVGGDEGDDDNRTTFAASITRDVTITETYQESRSSAPSAQPEAHESDDAAGEPSASAKPVQDLDAPAASNSSEAGAGANDNDTDDDRDDDNRDQDHGDADHGNDDQPVESTAARDNALDDRDPDQPSADHGHSDHQSNDDHDHHHDDHHHETQDQHEGEPQEATRRTSRGSDMLEEVPARTRRRPRSYKIQEVIKRRQIILVQVVKEERGNKGAALTTYLSLAGRYTVLMPNTARGGGISRKITNPQDRKRLKSIAQELDVPEGMGLIIRTAGAARTKQEIKRDFEYLLRLWESVRDLTLQSTAPSLVYEEGDLIKRSIRDLYNKDVEEVVVAGEGGHREAADFMHMLLPSHSKNVVHYDDPTPLFARYGVERQLNAMFSPQVTLRSGGYIVINQTEALVAIDVNSGKSTREFSIEETALATNLEASDEIARQLKLRDLAGLIVIDFIDMEEKRNNRAVERRLKDALRHDRARIQLGRISHFGLMEMSRQRLRTGVLEGSTSQCPHCQGTGIIRSTESVALAVLRGIEDAITAGAQAPLIATTTTSVALYILNAKRAYVTDMEARHGHSVTVVGSERIHGANFTIERGQATVGPQRRPERAAVNMDWGFEGEDEEAPAPFDNVEMIAEHDDPEEGTSRDRQSSRDGGEDEGGSRRRRRRRRRGRRGERGDDSNRQGFSGANGDDSDSDDDTGESAGANDDDATEGDNEPQGGDETGDHQDAAANGAEGEEGREHRRRRRRGRRGGRRGRGDREQGDREPGERTAASATSNLDDDAEDGAENTSDDEPSLDFSEPSLAAQPNVSADALPNSLGDVNGADDQPSAESEEPASDTDQVALDLGTADDDSSTVEASNAEPVKPARAGRGRPRGERKKPERLWDAAGEASVTQPVVPDAAVESTSNVAIDVEAVSVEAIRSAADTAAQVEGGNNGNAVVTGAEVEKRETRSRRHETGSSEPRIERVVMRPDQKDDGNSESAPAQQRKGWWQRRFGSE